MEKQRYTCASENDITSHDAYGTIEAAVAHVRYIGAKGRIYVRVYCSEDAEGGAVTVIVNA